MTAIMVKLREGRLVLAQERFPDIGEFDRSFLLDRPEGVRWVGERIDIRLSNARAVYMIDPYESTGSTIVGKLAYSEDPGEGEA